MVRKDISKEDALKFDGIYDKDNWIVKPGPLYKTRRKKGR